MNSVWRDIKGLPDEQAAEMVRADKISILVDLSGHSSGNRLGLFALKPAPVQVSWLGYPHSTGLRQMDYFLTDALCDPPGLTDQLYTEKLIRLPGSFCCYLPPVDFPVVSPPPSVASGNITFGSFNSFAKVNDQLIEIWSKLLFRVPGSRLFLKSMCLGDRAVQQAVLTKFRTFGVSEDRIALLSTVDSPLDHLALYSQIDIALDTYPYHGTTTTCEALWMGVPVVTLAGRCHAARVGVSLLSSARLETLIAGSPEEYVDIAVNLANDNELRGRMRDNLRLIFATSPLMDAVRVTREVESVYIQICEIHCHSQL
jgi:predicted O-linked N-acetylglucosamine transferase (SPINDLY family)